MRTIVCVRLPTCCALLTSCPPPLKPTEPPTQRKEQEECATLAKERGKSENKLIIEVLNQVRYVIIPTPFSGQTLGTRFQDAWKDVLDLFVFRFATHNIHVSTTSNLESGVGEMNDCPILLKQVDFLNCLHVLCPKFFQCNLESLLVVGTSVLSPCFPFSPCRSFAPDPHVLLQLSQLLSVHSVSCQPMPGGV